MPITEPPTGRFARPTPATALLVAACLFFACHAAIYWDWVEDDAYISLRYATNLATGEGLVFNPGERVEAYSNLPWVLLESGAIRVGLDGLHVARVAGILAGLGCLLVSWRLACDLNPGAGAVAAALAPWFLAINPILPRHAVSGLETDGHAFLLGAGVLLAVSPGSRRRDTALAILLVVLSCSRPEGPAFAACLAAWAWWRRPVPRRIWLPALAVLVAVGTWRFRYYGSLLPNTFHFKMTGGTAALVPGIHYAVDFLRENGGAVLVGLGLLPLLKPAMSSRTWGLAFLIALQAAIAVTAGGDWMAHYRFFGPVLPLAAAMLAAGLATAGELAAPARRPRLAAIVAAACLGAMAVNIAKVERQVWRLYMPAVRSDGYLSQAYARVGTSLKESTPPGTMVAASDIGAIGLYSGHRIVDMFGLVDPHIARLPGGLHAKHDAAYVLRRDPDVVILVEGSDATCQPVYWRLPDRALAEHPGFALRYRLDRTFPIAFQNETVQVFVRR